MTIAVNGDQVVSAASSGAGPGGCTMGPVTSNNMQSPFQTSTLLPGLHHLKIMISSQDGLYHLRAFYEITFSFAV